MKYKYYQVYEYSPGDEDDVKRLIYTFDNEMAAHDLIEFLYRNDAMHTVLGMEEYEASTKL